VQHLELASPLQGALIGRALVVGLHILGQMRVVLEISFQVIHEFNREAHDDVSSRKVTRKPAQ
jgi:hypothetical protein